MSGGGPQAQGLFGSVRMLAASLVALVHTRLELFGTELQEELARLVLALILSFAAVFFAGLGIAFVGMAIVVAAWENHRLAAAVGLAIFFLGLGGIGAWAVRRLVFARLRLFNASLAELDRDYARLKAYRQSQQAARGESGQAHAQRAD
jgi:uncharacterized membrane protein YqjE